MMVLAIAQKTSAAFCDLRTNARGPLITAYGLIVAHYEQRVKMSCWRRADGAQK
jgi:hypothetical protein